MLQIWQSVVFEAMGVISEAEFDQQFLDIDKDQVSEAKDLKLLRIGWPCLFRRL